MEAAAVRHLRRLALALALGAISLWVTAGLVSAACTQRDGAACGPIRFEGSPTDLAVGVAVGSTCVEPGTSDYLVTLSGPGGFERTLAQGAVNAGTPILAAQVIKVKTAGAYTLTVTTTTNQGETGTCVTGTTQRTVQVPSAPKPTPTPSPSPTPTPSPSPTPEPTEEPTAEPPVEEVTEPPVEEVTEPPSEAPVESASEGPATFEPNPSVGAGSPSPSGTDTGGAGTGGGGGGPDLFTLGLVGVVVVGGIAAAAAALFYVRQGRSDGGAPWRSGPWKCARCNAVNREGTDRCRRCYARWDGTP